MPEDPYQAWWDMVGGKVDQAELEAGADGGRAVADRAVSYMSSRDYCSVLIQVREVHASC